MKDITKELLKTIGEKTGTDKICHHGYERFYFHHIAILKNKKDFAIIEIGYGSGSSVKFWKDLFPDAYLYCFDRDVQIQGDGFKVVQCDQSEIHSLRKSAHEVNLPVNLIIDDGSHLPLHQITSFNYLFANILQDGGVYIIEDIETSYWRYFDVYGYKTRHGIYHPKSAVEIFKNVIDYLNCEYISSRQIKKLNKKLSSLGFDNLTVKQIGEISFGQNCIIIHKKTIDDRKYDCRKYGLVSRVSTRHAIIEWWNAFKKIKFLKHF